jgi:hypothetical protein
MGLAFGYFNGFWWFFCFKNSGFVFNEGVESYFYDKRVASSFSSITFVSQSNINYFEKKLGRKFDLKKYVYDFARYDFEGKLIN